MNKRMRRRLAAVAAGAGMLTVAGVAFAAWTSTGTGSGTAQATDAVNSTIKAKTFAPDLYPGALKSVTVEVDNPNAYPVVVTYLSNSSSAAQGACAAGSVFSSALGAVNSNTALTQANGSSTVIAPGATGEYRVQTRMIGDADNACKNATFALPMTASLRSEAVTAP